MSILFKPGYGPVQQDLREIGKEIKALKPEAIVITCGHFQGEGDAIEGKRFKKKDPLLELSNTLCHSEPERTHQSVA